jgi:hypothetical protein
MITGLSLPCLGQVVKVSWDGPVKPPRSLPSARRTGPRPLIHALQQGVVFRTDDALQFGL